MAIANQFELPTAIEALQKFYGRDLTRTIKEIEKSLENTTAEACGEALATYGANTHLLSAAGLVKHLAGQIHVIIHALGILLCLPRILLPGEIVEYVSLGAGNTGRRFDLETNQRIAEFKFIRWQGGSEVIRQNVFKDFYEMAEYATDKQRFLYVLGINHPERFFKSGRAMSSVLSRHVRLRDQFTANFGDQDPTVRDYYLARKDLVTIEDMSVFVPELLHAGVEVEDL